MITEPCTYVIFGATGNLARLKLMPGFYHLELENKLPEGTRIVAVGRRPWDRETWLAEVRAMLEEKAKGDLDDEVFARFSERLVYHRGNLDEAQCYSDLATLLNGEPRFSGNMAFYLAIGPGDFGTVIESLSRAKLFSQEYGWRRIVI
jgi:glucose-6-phosphate 1-dehydrogenase